MHSWFYFCLLFEPALLLPLLEPDTYLLFVWCPHDLNSKVSMFLCPVKKIWHIYVLYDSQWCLIFLPCGESRIIWDWNNINHLMYKKTWKFIFFQDIYIYWSPLWETARFTLYKKCIGIRNDMCPRMSTWLPYNTYNSMQIFFSFSLTKSPPCDW